MNETPKNINHLTAWSTISFIVVFRCAIPFAFVTFPFHNQAVTTNTTEDTEARKKGWLSQDKPLAVFGED